METEWPEIELGGDPASSMQFWDTVLEFAAADRATSVEFVPARKEKCINLCIDGQNYYLVPPPAEYLRPLFSAGQRRAAGGGVTGAIKLRLCRWARVPIRGTIALNGVIWDVACNHDALHFGCVPIKPRENSSAPLVPNQPG